MTRGLCDPPQDRADRAARYAQNHEELETARLAALQARRAEQEARRETPNRERRYGGPELGVTLRASSPIHIVN